MKYFLYANTEKKPVMRFFDHWFEVSDFFHVMKWGQKDIDNNHVEIFKEMNEWEIEEKNGKGP